MSEKFNPHLEASRLSRGDVTKWLSFDHISPTDELAPAIDAFNNEVAAANQQAAAIDQQVQQAVAAATSGGSAEDLVEATNKRRTLVLSDAQELLRLWRTRQELAERYVAACREASAAARNDAEVLQADVGAQAEAIGFVRGTDAAQQRRFDHLLRFSNSRVRAAFDRLDELSEMSRNSGKIKRESSEGTTQAERYLDATIQRVAAA